MNAAHRYLLNEGGPLLAYPILGRFSSKMNLLAILGAKGMSFCCLMLISPDEGDEKKRNDS